MSTETLLSLLQKKVQDEPKHEKCEIHFDDSSSVELQKKPLKKPKNHLVTSSMISTIAGATLIGAFVGGIIGAALAGLIGNKLSNESGR